MSHLCSVRLLVVPALISQEVVVGQSNILRSLFVNNVKVCFVMYCIPVPVLSCPQISSRCTSFGVHDEYLLYTTHQHKCVCVSLNTNPAGDYFLLHFICCLLLPLSLHPSHSSPPPLFVSVSHFFKFLLQNSGTGALTRKRKKE